MLKPLEQFICDECDEVIEKPEDGWLEWDSDKKTGKAAGFRIVHVLRASPRAKSRADGCQRPSYMYSMHLSHVLENAVVQILALVDIGEVHDPDFKDGMGVMLWREYALGVAAAFAIELLRRGPAPALKE